MTLQCTSLCVLYCTSQVESVSDAALHSVLLLMTYLIFCVIFLSYQMVNPLCCFKSLSELAATFFLPMLRNTKDGVITLLFLLQYLHNHSFL